ncbi:MAG: class I SAM-dependent methyltransferase, partial [Vicinamibacterales bacterium]
MSLLANQLVQAIHGADIFEGYVPEFPEDPHGGGFPDLFEALIVELKPGLVVEVGSWKGRSAIMLAGLLERHSPDGALVCVDTWLGGLEHLPPELSERWSIRKYRQHGYSRLYHQFLSNIVRAGVADRVVPFPNTSSIAAQWMSRQGVRPDLVFIDGSHEYADVLNDLERYYALLLDGGVLFGDDYGSFQGVARAVVAFADSRDLEVEISQGQVWLIRKGQKRSPLRPGERPWAAKSVLKRLAHTLGYRR